jgi:3-hydroxyacyl-CoA dehydrogenase/enoyl-CoA hydratase/3-hydroxybutyryl-CoA epimerase
MAFMQLQSLWVSELADGVASLMFDVPGSKTNNINRGVLEDLEQALDRIEQSGRFRLLIVRSGKENHFAAGPGIDDLAALKSPEDFAGLAEKGQHVFDRLQSLTMPTVAVINGSCQGGGLELTLACDYRVIVQNPGAKLSVAGSELGLMPAWGGTQRLPRLIGLERSLLMLLGDRALSADLARQWGLVDAVVSQSDELPPDFIHGAHKRPLGFLPRRTWRQWFFEGFRWGRWLFFHGAETVLKRRLPDDLPGPWEILSAVKRGLEQGMPIGLEQERTALGRLSQHFAFRNLLRGQQAIGRIRQSNVERKPLRNIGFVGTRAGGLQVPILAVSKGCHIVVRETDETTLGMVLYQVLSYFLPALQSGAMSTEEFQKQVLGTKDWKGFPELDMVLAAPSTDMDQRRILLRHLEQETRPETLLVVSNGDPCLAELHAGMKHPERLAGLHFVPPVTRGSVVEVVGPPAVEARVAESLSAWVVHLGGIPVFVQDRPGMLVQRVWLAAILEALLLVQERIDIARIDEALRRFGMLRGPLELADLIGLPQVDALVGTLDSSEPTRFSYDPLLGFMIEKGWLGQQSKLGFYRHDKRSMKPNSQVPMLIRDLQGEDIQTDLLSPKEQRDRCRERLVGRTINEAAWCLQEGVVADADTLDLALVLAGWAPHRGGPLTCARQQGIQQTIDSLTELASRWGERFQPCPFLKSLAKV